MLNSYTGHLPDEVCCLLSQLHLSFPTGSVQGSRVCFSLMSEKNGFGCHFLTGTERLRKAISFSVGAPARGITHDFIARLRGEQIEYGSVLQRAACSLTPQS